MNKRINNDEVIWDVVIDKQRHKLLDIEMALRNLKPEAVGEARITTRKMLSRDFTRNWANTHIPKHTQALIYTIRSLQKLDIKEIDTIYEESKSLLKKQKVALSQRNKRNISDYLYVGARRNNLRNGLMQHFGFGAERSFSLKLNNWFSPHFNNDIVINWYYFPTNESNLLSIIERGFWLELKPLFGGLPDGLR